MDPQEEHKYFIDNYPLYREAYEEDSEAVENDDLDARYDIWAQEQMMEEV